MEIKVKKTLTLILSQDEARLVAGLLVGQCIHGDCPFVDRDCDGKEHPACYAMGELLNKALEG